MGGIIKKIASIAKPFIAMIPGVGPMIAKGIDIAMQAIDKLQALRKSNSGQSVEKRDSGNSQVSGPAAAKKDEANQAIANGTSGTSAPTPKKKSWWKKLGSGIMSVAKQVNTAVVQASKPAPAPIPANGQNGGVTSTPPEPPKP